MLKIEFSFAKCKFFSAKNILLQHDLQRQHFLRFQLGSRDSSPGVTTPGFKMGYICISDIFCNTEEHGLLFEIIFPLWYIRRRYE